MASRERLNILHLTTHLNLGGISSYLAVLCPALTKRGHTVSVLSSGGAKTGELDKKGVRCHVLPLRTKSELDPKLWASLPEAVSIAKREKIGLLHAHTRVTQVLAAAMSRLTGLPYMSTAHGFYRPRFGRRLFPCWGERVVAVGELVADELERTHHLPREKITVVVNALDVEGLTARLAQQDRNAVREEYGIPPGAFVVGCISRLVRDKGQEYLVEAVKLLEHTVPGVFLCIVGDGRERPNLAAMIKRLSVENRVKLIAGVNDTAGLLSVLDVFAHPATYREGFGLSMAEAMLAGVPVVATDIPAINTIFRDGSAGETGQPPLLLVAPKHAAALADAIHSVAVDPALARRLSEAGHALALRQCRAERQAEEMEKIYLEVLSKSKERV